MQGRRYRRLPDPSGDPQRSKARLGALRRSDLQRAVSTTKPPRSGPAAASASRRSRNPRFAGDWTVAPEMLLPHSEQVSRDGSLASHAIGRRRFTPSAVTPAAWLLVDERGSVVPAAGVAPSPGRAVCGGRDRALPTRPTRKRASAQSVLLFSMRSQWWPGQMHHARPHSAGAGPSFESPLLVRSGSDVSARSSIRSSWPSGSRSFGKLRRAGLCDRHPHGMPSIVILPRPSSRGPHARGSLVAPRRGRQRADRWL
jgi:hypothetical protein